MVVSPGGAVQIGETQTAQTYDVVYDDAAFGTSRRGPTGDITAPATLPSAINMHFEDRLEDGKMIFDYRMRPGVVEHSNALALMRAIGLNV